MAKPRTKYFHDVACAQCGIMITPQERFRSGGKFNGLWMPQKFCSRGCANSARPKKIWMDKHGYPQATIDGRSMAMHRHVMEKKIGRRLLSTETVHHIDGNRKNYDESNLELWSNRHGKGQRVSDLHPVCVGSFAAGALALGG